MKRTRKQISAMLLAVVTAMTSITTPVSAKTAVGQDKVHTKEAKETASYKEGEAVVMYYGSGASTWSTKKETSFGDGITVEETYDFTPAQPEKARAGKESMPEVLVSKVSSNTYSTEELVARLKEQESVEFAEPNYICEATGTQNNANYAPYQWALKNNGQNGGTEGCDIKVESAWEKKTGTDKVIAIIDSGVDYTHPDLRDNMWNNPYTDQLKGQHGYDFINKDEDPMDDNNHGTHCAGIIAGSGNGISGVNQTAKIMALKFLGSSGSGELVGAIGAYDYINRAIDLGVNIVAVNNSWGGGPSSKIIERLINMVGEKGCVSVIAAGNEGHNVDYEDNYFWNFNSDYTLRVAASTENDELASFSNYGWDSIDLAAPGANILSSVAKDTYNPTIHMGDSNYSEILNTFENQEEVDAYKCINASHESSVELSTGEGQGFGAAKNNSLKFKVHDPLGGGMHIVYRPIELPESTTDYHMSAMVKTVADNTWFTVLAGVSKISDIENRDDYAMSEGMVGSHMGTPGANCWDMFSGTTHIREFDPNEKYGVWVAVSSAYGENNIEVEIDNVGISKKDMAPESFGKYSFFNGTSMAAPQVTGAVALVSELTGQQDAKALRNTVANCTRNADSIGYKVKSGVLDLSKVDTQAPVMDEAIADEDTITIKGRFLGDEKGIVRIEGQDAKIKSWRTDQIVLEETTNKNKQVFIELATSKDQWTYQMLYIEYDKKEVKSLGEIYDVSPSVAGTDGESLYVLDGKGNFTSFNKETGKSNKLDTFDIRVFDKDAVNTVDAEFTYGSQLVYADHAFYLVASYDVGYITLDAVVCYDLQTGKWRKAAELPSALKSVTQPTLAAYKEKLYLIGGFDTKKEKALSTVYSMEYASEIPVFKEESQKAPARFASLAHVVGDKLVLTLGGDGTITEDVYSFETPAVPNNIVFDGSKWTEVKGASFTPERCEYLRIGDERGAAYFTAQTGICDGGILYAGLETNGLGAIFTYNLKANKYTAVPCALYKYKNWNHKVYGTSVADQFMFLVGGQYHEGDHTSKYSLYSFAEKTGFYQVAGDAKAVDGVGYHYPGSKVELRPNPAKGQYVTKFMVDGKEVNDSVYTIPSIMENHQVEAAFASQVKEIRFDKPEYTATVGQPLTINVEAVTTDELSTTDANRFTWTVDNEQYATINNGILTPLKEGGSVVVTATAKDGSNKTASVVVRIPENKVNVTSLNIDKTNLQLKKNDSYQLRMSLQPWAATNQNVIWESSRSWVAMVSNTGEIIARNPGKTTITVRALDGSGVKATCEVEVLPGNVNKVKAKQTTNSITLSWNKVSGVSGYKVYRYDQKSKKDIEVCTLNGDNSVSTKIMKLNGKSGSKLASGTEYTYKVVPFVNYGNMTRLGDKLSIKTATAPAATKVKKVQKKSSKKAEITWSKVSGATGYEVCVSTSKKGKYKTIAKPGSANKVSYRQSGLKKGKTYYYKVRTYKKVGQTYIYGSYSNVKSFKMK